MEYTGGSALRRKYLDKGSRIPKIKLTKENSFLVFPFELTMGFITSTETGITQDNVSVYDYSTFQRVFTGLENILAKWEGAYDVTKQAIAFEEKLVKEYKVGRSFRGYITDEQLGATFEPSPLSGNFLSEITDETFTLHTYDDLQEADLFKLFIIPGLKEFKWLYIESATKYFTPDRKLHHVEITMQTLNNKVATSGRAIEEFIQRSAPGEGYAWPVVDNEGNITVDEIRNRDIPITSMQVEFGGAIAMGTLYCYGRPTKSEIINGVEQQLFNPIIEAPRRLMPYRIETPISSPINTKPASETDWVVGNWKPVLAEGFGDWKEQFTGTYDLNARAEYEGLLVSTNTKAKVNETNPVAGGSRSNIMWDQGWSFNVEKTFNTSTESTCVPTLTLNGPYTLPKLLCHNIYGLNPYISLPLSVEQNTTWSLKDIPIIGGFLTRLTLGIPITWTNTAVKVKMDNLPLVLPASLVDYADVLLKQNTEIRIDMNTFTDDASQNEAIDKAGIKSIGSIFKVRLTDLFEKTIGTEKYVFSTEAEGQLIPPIDQNGKNLPFGTRTQILKWDESCIPIPPKIKGFIIDMAVTKAIAKMDYRIAFFSNDVPVWSGTYQTNAKFTNSMRDWTNAIKMSDWKESNNQILDYPEAIVAPFPPAINNPVIELFKDITITSAKVVSPSRIIASPSDFISTRIVFPRTTMEARALIHEKTFPIISKEIYEFDLTPLGGINGLKNNYESLDINFSVQAADGTTDKYNLSSKLILANFNNEQVVNINFGQIPTKFWQNIDSRDRLIYDTTNQYQAGQYPIAIQTYNGQSGLFFENEFYNHVTPNRKSDIAPLKFVIDGSKLKVNIEGNYTIDKISAFHDITGNNNDDLYVGKADRPFGIYFPRSKITIRATPKQISA